MFRLKDGGKGPGQSEQGTPGQQAPNEEGASPAPHASKES